MSKKYKIDEYTTVKKLGDGTEIVIEDYSKDISPDDKVCRPKQIIRKLHPNGRQDCHMVMSGPFKKEAKKEE